MTQLLHDGHLRVKPTIGGITLQELPSGDLLGGIHLPVDLGCHLVHRGEGSFTDCFDHVVFCTAHPGSLQSTPRGIWKISSGCWGSWQYIRASK